MSRTCEPEDGFHFSLRSRTWNKNKTDEMVERAATIAHSPEGFLALWKELALSPPPSRRALQHLHALSRTVHRAPGARLGGAVLHHAAASGCQGQGGGIRGRHRHHRHRRSRVHFEVHHARTRLGRGDGRSRRPRGGRGCGGARPCASQLPEELRVLQERHSPVRPHRRGVARHEAGERDHLGRQGELLQHDRPGAHGRQQA